MHPVRLPFVGFWHPVPGLGVVGAAGVFAVAASAGVVTAWVLIPGILCCSGPEASQDMLQRVKQSKKLRPFGSPKGIGFSRGVKRRSRLFGSYGRYRELIVNDRDKAWEG